MAKVDKQTIASAPDYETLDEQQIIVGEKERPRGHRAVARIVASDESPASSQTRGLALSRQAGLAIISQKIAITDRNAGQPSQNQSRDRRR